MNDDEIKAAIAEACGLSNRWVLLKRGLYYRPNANGYTSNVNEAWIVSEEEANKHVYPHDEPVTKQRAPSRDYTNDLNAMHDAEKTLPEKLVPFYLTRLLQVRFRNGADGGMIACMVDKLAFATAHQRAEAFLRTIGKWRD